MANRKISAAGTATDPQGDDRILTQRSSTNPVTTWTRVYTWIKAQLDLVYSTLALGELSTTAYRGDRGKTAYDHSQAAHAPSDAVSLATVKGDSDVASAISLKHASGSDAETIATVGTILTGASADTPLDADTFNFWDAVDSILKKITWANIIATLRTAFFSTVNGIIKADGLGNISSATPNIDYQSAASTGERSTAVDSGSFGQISITDDYMYVCTKTGTAGNAIWKKVVMFQT